MSNYKATPTTTVELITLVPGSPIISALGSCPIAQIAFAIAQISTGVNRGSRGSLCFLHVKSQLNLLENLLEYGNKQE